MIRWLSNYDYDFAIAAVPIQIILLIFYGLRRNLPIRQSVSFSVVMITNLLMTIFDIVSCEINELYLTTPHLVLYLVNILYFVSFIVRGWALFDYTCESCREYKIISSHLRKLSFLPALFVCILIVITPWFSTIFTITDSGYQNCVFYKSIYYCTYFYIIISFVVTFSCFKHLKLRVKAGLISFNTILFIGLILRKLLYGNYLITSYVSILAILVIFITSENPDLYRDKQTKLFNKEAFDLIGINYLYNNKSFHCVSVSVHNYEFVESLYGSKQLNESLLKLGENLLSKYKGYYVFYFDEGNFLLLKQGRISDDKNNSYDVWKTRFANLHSFEDGDITLSISTLLLPFDVLKNNINNIKELLTYSFNSSFKENQKGNYLFKEDNLSELLREKDVENAINNALENNTISVYFQPIYSVKEEKIVGAEALARLIDPKIGYIPPLEFINIAEKNGAIMELGRQIFEKTCNIIERLDLRSKGIEFINVNLSPAQCLNNGLSNELAQIASKHNIQMNMFDFEITESSADDFLSIQKQMYLLQENGAELSLDDFGTGTSNLTRLMNLPIHVVKIDMDVTHAYFKKEASFLPDLIKMFQNANMKIVVEGIETEEMKNVLSKLNCDYLQGFYFSKALPPEEFNEYLNNL